MIVLPLWIGRGLYGYDKRGELSDIATPESCMVAQHFLHEVLTV